jgi:hypothetical protein
MTLIVNGFQDPYYSDVVRCCIEEVKPETCYVIYDKVRLAVPSGDNAPRVIQLPWEEINWDARYPIAWDELAPPDSGVLHEMGRWEGEILAMMARLEFRKPVQYEKRRELFFKHLLYWNHVISADPDVVFISSNVPHEIFDYIIYRLCGYYGRKTLCFLQSQIKDTVHILRDIDTGFSPVAEAGQHRADGAPSNADSTGIQQPPEEGSPRSSTDLTKTAQPPEEGETLGDNHPANVPLPPDEGSPPNGADPTRVKFPPEDDSAPGDGDPGGGTLPPEKGSHTESAGPGDGYPGEVTLPPHFEAEYQRNVGTDNVPFYMEPVPGIVGKILRDPKTYMHKVTEKDRVKDFFRHKFYSMRTAAKTKPLMRFYDKVAEEPDLTRRFIYLPLHYQPEMTTSPLAGYFAEQRFIVRLLSDCVPDDLFIYVKEHPKQTYVTRSKLYYEEIRRFRNVRLIDRRFDSFTLIKNSVAVATATGTAGWEALFKAKPVLMFGNNFYRYAPGAFPITDRKDCIRAIRDIIDGAAPTLPELRAFMKSLEPSTFNGIVDPVYLEQSALSGEENLTTIKTVLRGEIRAMLSSERS